MIHYTLTLDQIRRLVFDTSVAYAHTVQTETVQIAELVRHQQLLVTLAELAP